MVTICLLPHNSVKGWIVPNMSLLNRVVQWPHQQNFSKCGIFLEYCIIYSIFCNLWTCKWRVKSRNGCGNKYESQWFVRVLKKTCECCFWQFWERIKKRDRCPCGQNMRMCSRNIIAYLCRGLHYLSMDTKNSFFGLHMNFWDPKIRDYVQTCK